MHKSSSSITLRAFVVRRKMMGDRVQSQKGIYTVSDILSCERLGGTDEKAWWRRDLNTIFNAQIASKGQRSGNWRVETVCRAAREKTIDPGCDCRTTFTDKKKKDLEAAVHFCSGNGGNTFPVYNRLQARRQIRRSVHKTLILESRLHSLFADFIRFFLSSWLVFVLPSVGARGLFFLCFLQG